MLFLVVSLFDLFGDQGGNFYGLGLDSYERQSQFYRFQSEILLEFKILNFEGPRSCYLDMIEPINLEISYAYIK